MFDIVIPQGNECELLAEAKRLGFSELIFLYDQKTTPTSLPECRTACIVRKEDVSRIPKLRKTFSLLIGDGKERSLFESKVDMLLGMETTERPDSEHYRRSGLNQVLCKLAKGKTLLFDFSVLLGEQRTLFLGRYMQNASFARKYGVACALCSFARRPEDMRSAHDLAALARVLST